MARVNQLLRSSGPKPSTPAAPTRAAASSKRQLPSFLSRPAQPTAQQTASPMPPAPPEPTDAQKCVPRGCSALPCADSNRRSLEAGNSVLKQLAKRFGRNNLKKSESETNCFVAHVPSSLPLLCAFDMGQARSRLGWRFDAWLIGLVVQARICCGSPSLWKAWNNLRKKTTDGCVVVLRLLTRCVIHRSVAC